MRTLADDDYHSVTLETESSLVTIKRKSTPFATVVECNRVYTELVHLLETLDLHGAELKLLFDLREVAPRNDPEYERIIGTHRKRVLSSFANRALLVKTAAGALQVSRHARDDGLDVGVFTDELEARRYLIGEPSETR